MGLQKLKYLASVGAPTDRATSPLCSATSDLLASNKVYIIYDTGGLCNYIKVSSSFTDILPVYRVLSN